LTFFIPDKILIFILKFRLKYKKITFYSGSKINRKTILEGHNVIYNNVDITNSKIGYGTYISRNSILRNANIGKYSAIGENVRCSLGIHPTKNFVSIHPAFFSIEKQAGFTYVDNQLFLEHKYVDSLSNFVCEIGNDVWIGNNVMILDGIKIGDGAIIAAGSIITKNIEPYSIYAGVPGKLVKMRFNDEEIQNLLLIKWWNWKESKIKLHIKKFESIKTFVSNINNT
jgi:acetyltransferase-like isoleucine patch superfamily enzyme